MMAPPSVLFVCLGNICRSPLAQGVFEHVCAQRNVDAIEVDSCGTAAYHAGEPADSRSIAVAKKHGIDISDQRARQLHIDDFTRFDHVVAMDSSNLDDIRRRMPAGSSCQLHLFSTFVADDSAPKDVPDPYYGGKDGFQNVYNLLVDGMDELIDLVTRSG